MEAAQGFAVAIFVINDVEPSDTATTVSNVWLIYISNNSIQRFVPKARYNRERANVHEWKHCTGCC